MHIWEHWWFWIVLVLFYLEARNCVSALDRIATVMERAYRKANPPEVTRER